MDPGGLLVDDPRYYNTWNRLIVQLNHFLKLKDDWDGRGADAPALSVVYASVSLAHLFRDEDMVAACRVSAGECGMVHFEWYRFGCNLAITVRKPDEVEVVSYSNLGRYTSEVFRWGSRPIEAIMGIVKPLTGRPGLDGVEIFAV